ncbi:MAG: hypothetical protein R2854_12900 [Caldilineaceae bacterium]
MAIEAETDGGRTVIGQVDRGSATLLAHDGAVYIHEGASYQVERLDLEQNLATVVPANVDFYTEVTSETQVETLAVAEERVVNDARVAHGELLISSQAVGYRRIKRFTHETLGVFPLAYPPQQLETNGYWISVQPAAQLSWRRPGSGSTRSTITGPTGRRCALKSARDGYRCAQCGARAARPPTRRAPSRPLPHLRLRGGRQRALPPGQPVGEPHAALPRVPPSAGVGRACAAGWTASPTLGQSRPASPHVRRLRSGLTVMRATHAHRTDC